MEHASIHIHNHVNYILNMGSWLCETTKGRLISLNLGMILLPFCQVDSIAKRIKYVLCKAYQTVSSLFI